MFMCTSIFNMFRGVSTFAKTSATMCESEISGVASRSQIYNEVGLIRFPALSLSQCTDASVAWQVVCREVSVPAMADPQKVLFSLASGCLTMGGWGVLYV